MTPKKQADEPDDLRGRFDKDLQTAKKFMDPIHQAMDKNYEMYRNRWNDNNTDFKVSDLYAYVETVVPILTNNRVRGSVHSDYPEYVRHAQGLTDILDNTYDINDWDYEAQEIARMAEIFRSAIAYTGYDEKYKNGTGKLCLYGCNIRWCYLDPGATKFEDSSFFFYVEPKRKTEVIKMYPDKKKDITETIGNAREGMTDKVNNWFKSFIKTIKQAVTFNSDNTAMTRMYEDTMAEMSEEEKHRNNVAFIHYWYRDDDDKWRCSYWADDVFLEDMENPFDHGLLPYDIYNPTKDILSSTGIPMAEHIQNLNEEKNVLMDLIIRHGKKAVEPPLMYNTAMGIKDPEALKEQAKKGVIPVNNPDMVPLNAIAEYFTPPQLPNFVENLPDRYSAMEDRITGVNDSFRGMSEATSGKEVQLKQEAAYTRIKTKVDNFERFNKSIAQKIIQNAMQYYDKERAFRVKGDYTKYADLQDAEDAPFSVQPIVKQMQTVQQQDGTQAQQPVYDRSEFFLYANPNEWTRIVDEPQETEGNEAPQAEQEEQKPGDAKRAYKILQMTVEIEAGSSLPTSRLARREEALELGQAGYIDQEAVLEAFDWPDRDEIVKRMQEAAQAQQQAQMQQAQMQAEQQMQLKQMEMQHQQGLAQMKQQPQPNVPDVAGGLDKIRQAVPELANIPDDQLAQLVAQLKIA